MFKFHGLFFFLVIIVGVGASMFVGTWFHNAILFADAHTLLAALNTKPIVCTFQAGEFEDKTVGTIRIKDGMAHFDTRNKKDSSVLRVEIDVRNPDRMMSQTGVGEYVSLENYPQLREQLIEGLESFVSSETLHCAPWWYSSSYTFKLQEQE